MYVVAGKGADEQWEENQMEEFGHLLPFEVNPFVAEHSLGRSFVQQGDRFFLFFIIIIIIIEILFLFIYLFIS